VSPPRVESDTLYQLDTQSRAAQDLDIIASSRLFSMGNLRSNPRMLTILIFGAAIRPDGQPSTTLRRRVEAADATLSDHPNSQFMATGAVGRYGPSEASVMARLLMESGVRSDRIELEETGHDTLSSVRAIRRLSRERGSSGKFPGKFMVATSRYHLPRCLALLCLAGMAARPCPSCPGLEAGAGWKKWYWRVREVPALPYDVTLALWYRATGRL
jgi:vancomycin permeability regulator SanA